jgi:hypothetical protein
MDTFGKQNSPQVIQEIQLSAYRGRKLRTNMLLGWFTTAAWTAWIALLILSFTHVL